MFAEPIENSELDYFLSKTPPFLWNKSVPGIKDLVELILVSTCCRKSFIPSPFFIPS
jgi:hypothetical protein